MKWAVYGVIIVLLALHFLRAWVQDESGIDGSLLFLGILCVGVVVLWH